MSAELISPGGVSGFQRRSAHRIQKFSYDHPDLSGAGQTPFSEKGVREQKDPQGTAPDLLGSQAYQEGWEAAREALEGSLREQREALLKALEDFSEERSRYFRQMEKEVVELSLSIARRILHREAQVDPLVLRGAAHAMLDRLADGSDCVMRLHPARIQQWETWLEERRAGRRPRLEPDPSLSLDECVLETPSASAKVGFESQLQEIETGFCDALVESLTSK